MRLIFVHQYFYPEIAGSALRLTDVAVGLVEKGFGVSVVTGNPNYAGKRSVAKTEKYRGVEIYRVSSTRLNKQTSYGRALNAVTFFFSALIHVLSSDKQALLVIGSDPPFLSVIGWWMKIFRGQEYVLHVADLYPDIAVQLGHIRRRGVIDHVWRWINSRSFEHAKKIITLGEYMKHQIAISSSLLTDEKVHIIENWEDGHFIHPIPKQENWFAIKQGLVKKTVILHSGNLGLAYDLESSIEAALLLRKEKNITFLFVGEGGQRRQLELAVKEKGLGNVYFLPYQAPENLPYSLASGDIALISMKLGVEGLCVPGKAYTALASGSAILGVVPKHTEVAQLIEEHDCGIRVSPHNAQKLAQAITTLHRDPELLQRYQKNARDAFNRYYTKDQALERYGSFFSAEKSMTERHISSSRS